MGLSIQRRDLLFKITVFLSVILVPIILLELYGVKILNNKYMAMLFFAYDIFLIIKYKLYRDRYVLLLMLFILWIGGTSIYAGAELSKAWGGVVARSWLICIFLYLVAYLIREEEKPGWFMALLSSIAVSSCIFFVIIMCNAFHALFDPSFESDLNRGIIQNGRLSGFGNANTIGPVAVIAVLVGVILISYVMSKVDCMKNVKIFRKIIGVVGVLAIVLSVIILSLCRSRASIISVGIGLALLIYKASLERWFIGSRKSTVKALIVALIFAFIVVALSLSTKLAVDGIVKQVAKCTVSEEQQLEIEQTITPFGYDYALDTLTDRALIWPATIRMIDDLPTRWIIGITAVESPTTHINYIYEDRPELSAVFAHNGFLQYMLMYGIPGAVLLVVILLSWSIRGVKLFFSNNSKDAIGYYLVPFAAVAIVLGLVEIYPFPFWSLQPASAMFFIAAGSCNSIVDKRKMNTEKEHRLSPVWAASMLVLFCLINTVDIASSKIMEYQNSHSQTHTGKAQTNEEAYILLDDSIENEMLTADYWIENCANRKISSDKLIMNTDEIEIFNQKNRKHLSTGSISIALEDIGTKFNGKVLKAFIEDSISEFSWDIENTTATKEQVESAITYANIENIGPNVDVNFAYSINRTTLRKLPGISDEIYSMDDTLKDYDIMAVSELMPFAKVVVLYESFDGEWKYVLTKDCGGWVQKDILAYCDSKEEWNELSNFGTEYIVVTGAQLIVNLQKGYSVSVPMGTLMPAKKGKDSNSQAGYYLNVPVSEDNKISLESVFISEEEDVLYGEYLPYTQENLLKQAFKLLGDEYGWAGTNNSVDCSLYIKEVYSSFGISLPRNSETQANVAGADCKKFFSGKAARIDYLKKAPAGALLYFNGHISMYIGCVDDVPFCISSVGQIETMDMEIGSKLAVNKVSVSDMLYTTRANGVSWLSCLESITKIE